MTDLGGFGRKGNDRTSLLEDEVRALRERLSMVPSVWAPAADITDRRLLIIGGQVVSGIDCIQYAASVTPAAAYDPDVTTTYPAGLGRAWLIENGENKGRVLVRHNLPGYMAVLIAGERARASYQEILTYDPGGGGAIVTMTAWCWDWV